MRGYRARNIAMHRDAQCVRAGPAKIAIAIVVGVSEGVGVSVHSKQPLRAAQSVDELLRAHGEALYDLCFRVLRDEALTEDVLQQVFLEVHRDFAHFEERAAPRTWLFSIAIHRCQDTLKAKRRYRSRVQNDEQQVDAFVDPAEGPEDQLHQQRLREVIAESLAHLSGPARTAILLRFQAGLSYEEMAVVLEEKSDTLHARVARAMSVLRRHLERKGWGVAVQ